ncbi:hypothetical protein AK812_SmicGene1657 [Symbiodinium microadriaticum]|uniref:Uncharacterized protein n=1 Tax=Symbiodinium microadriaticum TaxID=2951 RepID=A0A1Q9F3G5_SYMMI|nr:hypothetical protein AK812_SmicGene1657 [Symbiodinium microadriaticum]
MWCFSQSPACRSFPLDCSGHCAPRKDQELIVVSDACDKQARPRLAACQAMSLEASDRFWDGFQGSWYRVEDNRCVGEIYGNSMIWHAQWNMPEAESVLESLNEDTVLQEVKGHVLLGRIRRDAQMTILWSDGDVWLLK